MKKQQAKLIKIKWKILLYIQENCYRNQIENAKFDTKTNFKQQYVRKKIVK